jgi:phosphonate transport system substrate-binding protein
VEYLLLLLDISTNLKSIGKSMKILIQFIAIIYITFFIGLANADTADSGKAKPLVFGIVPQQSAAKLARNWVPLLKLISKNTGIELKFATAPDIPTFEKRLIAGEYDIAYMNPYHYAVLSKEAGFKALVHEQGKKIKGIIVANKNSKINKLEDLSMQTIAFPAPASFAATLIPKANLTQKNISFQSKYVNSHDAVYRNIAMGRYVAGGGIIRTFNALPERIRKQLKVIWTSDGYTPHAIATHPQVSEKVRQKLLTGFLDIKNSDASVQLLAPLRMKGFTQANDQEWNDVRSLDINLLLGKN